MEEILELLAEYNKRHNLKGVREAVIRIHSNGRGTIRHQTGPDKSFPKLGFGSVGELRDKLLKT